MARQRAEAVVPVDRQGRMVIPRHLRESVVDVPGSVVLLATHEGLLIKPRARGGAVEAAADGPPLLRLARPVTNAEVLDAIDRERSGR